MAKKGGFRFTNIKEFQYDVKKFKVNLERGMSLMTRKVALDGYANFIRKSPVDTGRFRAGWQIQYHSPSLWIPDDEAQKQARADADAKGKTKKGKRRKAQVVYDRPNKGEGRSQLGAPPMSPYVAIWVSNMLPYGGALNAGTSNQADAEWFEAVVESMYQQLVTASAAGFKWSQE